MDNLKSHLELLVQTAQSEVTNGLEDISNEIVYEPVMVWKFEKFDYSEKGIDTGRIDGSPAGIPSWNQAVIGIYNKLLLTKEYNSALEDLSQLTSVSFNSVVSLQMLLFKIVWQEIEQRMNGSIDPPSVSSTINAFIQQINSQQVNAKASAYIIGLTLESQSIELAPDILLRQTTMNDLTASTPLQGNSIHDDHQYPTAFLEIKRTVTQQDEKKLAEDFGRYVAILQLFGVGGIFRRQTVVTTDALITGFTKAAIYGGGHLPIALKPFYLAKQAEHKLKAFFAFMEKHMPDLTGHDRNMTLLAVSFDRYIDGCHESRLFERKIMNLVMGLEGLYVGDNLELSYKLMMRCSKAMRLCGIDPDTARNALKAAYSIRSTFAHGSYLKIGVRNKFETQFGSAESLATSIANYLRISLCAYIILGLKKDKIMEELDRAMLSGMVELELEQTFQALTDYLVV